MSHVVCNELFVNEPDVEAFETNFAASMRGTLPSVPGLVAARLLRPHEPGRAFVSILEFANSDAYLQYLDSAWFTAAHQWPDHAPIDHNRLTTYETIVEL